MKIPSDVLLLPVSDPEFSNKTLKDLINEFVEENIEDYYIEITSHGLKNCSIKTKNYKYIFINGIYDVFVKN